jgi:hypothetical protein
MLQFIKLNLRITSTAFDDEITALIEACKADLSVSGVGAINEADPLIQRAVTLYCKANFGYSEDSEKFQKSYEFLKVSLCLAGDEYAPGGSGDIQDVIAALWAALDKKANQSTTLAGYGITDAMPADEVVIKTINGTPPDKNGDAVINKGVVYQTSPVLTDDIWIDGKPIYRLVVTGDVTAEANAAKTITLISGVSAISGYRGFIKYAATTWYDINRYMGSATYSTILLNASNNAALLTSSSTVRPGGQDCQFYAVIEYTII